jgi:putative restriction endonuclease
MAFDSPVEGSIPGIPVGTLFESRAALRQAGVHTPRIHGIQGQKDFGCQSIVINGGYETDKDFGSWIWYTGAGGQKNRIQVADQSLEHSNNLALLRSIDRKNPIRVTRGPKSDLKTRPEGNQFRFDGLFEAKDVEEFRDSRGFVVYRFLLGALEGSLRNAIPTETPGEKPEKSERIVQYFRRRSSLARKVKEIYDYKCQICGVQLVTDVGLVADAAHIEALGLGGADEISNLLCLCPNHHRLFDWGGIWVDSGLNVLNMRRERVGRLEIHPNHQVDKSFLQKHRDIHFGRMTA